MQVAEDVLKVLSRCAVAGNKLTLPGQLDRSLYMRTDKVLKAAGGTWNRGAKGHLFEGEAEARIDQILLTGAIEIPKDEFEFFPTPPAVLERLMELANIRPGMSILEPSAGRGDIAVTCVDAGATVDCIELMEANVGVLLELDQFRSVRHADFLTLQPEPIYDRVVMNPPFGRQADIRHVKHALAFLMPGGSLTAVMSAGVSFRDNRLTREFRDLVEARGGFIEDLPAGSFKSAGTMVNTVIVTIPA